MATFQGLKQNSAEKQIFHLACKIINILFLKHHIWGDRCRQIVPMKQSISLQKQTLLRVTVRLLEHQSSCPFCCLLLLYPVLYPPLFAPLFPLLFFPSQFLFPCYSEGIVSCVFSYRLCYFYVWVFDDLWWCYRTWGKTTVFGCLFVNWIKNVF